MDTKTTYEVVVYNWDKVGDPIEAMHTFTNRYDLYKFTDTLISEGIEYTYFKETAGECVCGETIILGRFTNTCSKCERDYNPMGQLLGPREFWGEDTGEPWYAGDVGYADPDSVFNEEEVF
jgi:hypothetical protein